MSKEHPSILILDTYYPEFLKSAPLVGLGSYEAELAALMRRCFGTYDCYSRGLTSLGWKTEDFILNHLKLQLIHPREIEHQRDVLFYQDLNTAVRGGRGIGPVIAGQISCAWPGDETIKRFDILFTSFPHYVERIEALGVKAVYLPLAFDPVVYDRLFLMGGHGLASKRDIGCSFVGGIGTQWGDRAETIVKVREQIPLAIFTYSHNTYDYFPVWGLDMYNAYARSKIVLNRHHPAAQGYSNNLRMFEATGMGALLLTEHSPNIGDFFTPGFHCVTYTSPADAVDKIRYYLEHDNERELIAEAGRLQTLSAHTYTHRLPIVDQHLRGLL